MPLLAKLVKHGKLSVEEARRARLWGITDEPTLEEKLQRSGILTEQMLAEMRALELGIPLCQTLPDLNTLPEVNRSLPPAFARTHRLVLIEEHEESVLVATDDVRRITALDEVSFLLGKQAKPLYCSRAMLDEMLGALYRREQPAPSLKKKEVLEKKEPDLLESCDDTSPVISLLSTYLARAIEEDASDIHFEPKPDGLQIRFRIDGSLVVRPFDSPDLKDQLLTRIKVMAGLDIAEHRLAQDGRIQLSLAGRSVDLRVSVIPVANGQRIVLRILDKSKMLLKLSELHMPPKICKGFQKQIKKSEGMVLVTGPTGSGKTTSLYSALSEVNLESINIMTIEDPIEYRLEGISQMAVRPEIGLSFASGLRHLLRQDPDIIMVGEVRDSETAKIAVQAALTGHLVLTTLHTNDAPSAITRLVEMGVESYLLSSCLVGVLAQRLVRKICPLCKAEYTPTEEELKDLGIVAEKLWRAEGCAACMGTGYKGRQAIFELLDVDAQFRSSISQNPNADLLYRQAEEAGMETLKMSGSKLVLEGITTSAEVMRVTG